MKNFKKRLLSVFVLALFAVSTTQVFAKLAVPNAPQCVNTSCNYDSVGDDCDGRCNRLLTGWWCSCLPDPGDPAKCYCHAYPVWY